MLKYFFPRRSLNYFSSTTGRRKAKTIIQPIEQKAVKQVIQKKDNFDHFMKIMKTVGFLTPLTAGFYFAFSGLWSEFLTSKKRKQLSFLTYTIMGFGGVFTGALMGNYIYSGKSLNQMYANRLNSSFKLKCLLAVYVLYGISVELIERNLFYWGAGALATLGLLSKFYLLSEGTGSKSINITMIHVFKYPLILISLLSVGIYFTFYKERSRESTFVNEFKQRIKFVNHIDFK